MTSSPTAPTDPALHDLIASAVARLQPELIAVRRDIHAHPELGRTESRTTELVTRRLRDAGLTPRLLRGTGLVCDIGLAPQGARRLAFRADIDALPLEESSGLPYSSTVPGVAHSCGHDVHTAVLLGLGLILAELDAVGLLPRPVRLIFQPAEEIMPGGALDTIEQGVLEGVGAIYALHCEPRLDVGTIGTRIGPITSASDLVTVTASAAGGHTSRPHLTGDLVYALGELITQVPAILGRRLDPRSGVNLTWGAVEAGAAHNAIPTTGVLRGTLRCLDVRAWERAAHVLRESVGQVTAPFEVQVDVHHERGVPPVENDEAATTALEQAAREALGNDSVVLTEQSLGGEDFAWFLQKVPGALARLGTKSPGGRRYDIHQSDLVIDERAIGVGVRLLVQLATR